MTLEAVVFQQEQFSYSYKDFYTLAGGGGGGAGPWSQGLLFEEEKPYFETPDKTGFGFISSWDSPPSSMLPSAHKWDTTSSSQENPTDGFFSGGVECPAATTSRRKRRRTKSVKNKEEVENQRMTHITVERNRRKQMNDYLSVLRSMMPPSYVQRGDQASIIGGAIDFVKELEQHLQSLEARKRIKQRSDTTFSHLFSDFFTFPQYTTGLTHHKNSAATTGPMAGKQSDVADVEVTMVENHANLKILSRNQPRQLLKMVAGLHSLGLSVLHLNVTTVEHMVLYSFSVKVEDDCQLTTVNEIAAAVYDLVGRIQEEATFS